jgi:hypothetical protein
MSQAQQQHHNGNGTGQQMQRQIRDELDALDDIIQSSDSNPLLTDTNLGQGNYTTDYLWQQIRSYRKGLWAWNTFRELLTDRRRHETIMALGEEGLTHYNERRDEPVQIPAFDPADPDGRYLPDPDRPLETYSSWTLIRKRGEYIWREELGDPRAPLSEKQAAAMLRKSGDTGDWKPIYWQMIEGRHEASRSLDSTLIKYILGSVQERREQVSASEDGGGLLS